MINAETGIGANVRALPPPPALRDSLASFKVHNGLEGMVVIPIL